MSLPEEFLAEISEAVEASVTPEVSEGAEASGVESPGDSENKESKDGDIGTGEDGDIGTEVTAEGESGGGEGGSGEGDEGGGEAEQKDTPVSDHAIEQAVLLGVSVADAKGFRNEESLLRLVGSLRDAKESSERKDMLDKSEDLEEGDVLDNLPELDPEKYEPEVLAAFKSLTDVVRKQQESISEFRAQQNAASEVSNAAVARDVEQWFDKQINDLGGDFTEALGAGGYGDLAQGSSQLAKRDQIAEQMAVMLSGYQQTGIRAPAREEVFNSACNTVLRDEFAKIKDKKVSGKLEKRKSQHIQRAGGAKTKTSVSPMEETAQILDEKFFSKK